MTNTGTEVLSQLVLDQFVQVLAPITAFTLNATSQTSYQGETVKCLSVGTASVAQQFDKAVGYLFNDTSAEGKTVSLNKHYYTTAQISDSDWNNSAILSLDVYGRSKGHEIGKAIVNDIFTFFTSSVNCPTSMSLSSGSFSVDRVVDISKQLDDLNAPQFGRVLILNPQYHSVLRKDTAIQNAQAYAGSEVIRRGEISSVDTFTRVIKCDVLPTGVVGYAVVPQAAVVALRAVGTQDTQAYREVRPYTDEETGITITAKSYLDPQKGALNGIWELNAGWILGNNLGIVKLYAA